MICQKSFVSKGFISSKYAKEQVLRSPIDSAAKIHTRMTNSSENQYQNEDFLIAHESWLISTYRRQKYIIFSVSTTYNVIWMKYFFI